MKRTGVAIATIALCGAFLAGCSPSSDESVSGDQSSAPTTTSSATSSGPPSDAVEQQFPDVLEAELSASGDEFTVAVTISSPYDSASRYADGWRVLSPDGDVLSEHQLGHDHASEQPFTRTSAAFAIPDDVTEVTVEGRDQANGYGGGTVTIAVPR
ncbi:hypothetical protein [Demequina oxidasica]|uniref:hypothetical protein n=1 Tax=Demequina oxidasica TaxID=676199 RepID=UPI0007839B18|nr:hypothetical protein [Demequina oxidasica]